MERIKCFGFEIFSDNLDAIPLERDKCRIINTISPHSYGLSTKDPNFRESLKNSDYLVLDGVYFALASILLKGRNIKKNQGYDILVHFMKKIDEMHGKVFFLGSSQKTLESIKANAAADYPNISVGYFSPPFKCEFSEEDNEQMLAAVNEFSPDVLFIGMTCPKQEKWAFRNKDELKCRIACCIGAVFDWYAGSEKKIAPLWWKLRLGWLVRAIYRPEIIRRWPVIGIFFWHLVLAFLGFRKYRYGIF